MTGHPIPAKLVRVEGFCNQWGLDLTVGCRHARAYCHFQKYQALTLRHEHPDHEPAEALAVEEFLERQEYPPELYLSPFTDPLAPAARANLERVLERVLPLSVKVGISTKGVIPRRVFRLLAPYPEHVRLIVGVTSPDDRRNATVEPGCPPATARLANLRLAREYRLKKVTAKLRCLSALVVSLLVLAGCQKAADTQKPGTTTEEKEADIKGTVTAVAPDKTGVTLNHEAIPELDMKAMEMKYPVSDPKVLEGIAAGDKVSGRVKAKGTNYTITKLEKR